MHQRPKMSNTLGPHALTKRHNFDTADFLANFHFCKFRQLVFGHLESRELSSHIKQLPCPAARVIHKPRTRVSQRSFSPRQDMPEKAWLGFRLRWPREPIRFDAVSATARVTTAESGLIPVIHFWTPLRPRRRGVHCPGRRVDSRLVEMWIRMVTRV